ncbi:MAG: hypothetical protein LBM01_02975 [Christensenellaceae bacterium]|nr:hypothetical protein [Christensenellaceae bacterium]
MNKIQKALLIFAIIVVIGVVIAGAIIFGVSVADDTMRVRGLEKNDGVSRKIEEYEKSAMHLFDNNTFDVKIYFGDQPLFVAIGTYLIDEKAGEITMTFEDCEYFNGKILVKDTEPYLFRYQTKTFKYDGGEVRFIDHSEQIYYFK